MHSRAAARSGTSTTRNRVLQREEVIGPQTNFVPLSTRIEKDPPPYGAQHRQDGLWKGGNEVLPPLWQEFKVLHDKVRYVDNNIYMGSWNRPLPGVRLDQPGDLIPGCEWHISSLGRSYFVNHNTRTTTWKKPTLGRSAGGLEPERIIEGHSGAIWNLACLGTGCNIMSTSVDGSIRQWTTGGRPGGKSWNSEEAVGSIAVSPDEAMVVSGSAVDGRIRLWNIKEGCAVGDAWEGHTAVVRCLDWSLSAVEIASGSEDGTIRRWNPETGRQVIPTIETGHGWVFVVKYSPQGDKLASCGMDKMIRIWSKNGEPLIKIKGHRDSVTSFCWSKDSTYLFSGSSDCTIRKWRSMNGEQLLVLQGHTNKVTSLCLSPDESHLVSASRDCSIRIWDLKSNQSVGDALLHDDEICVLVMSPDGRHIFSAGVDGKIYIWNMEVALGGIQVGGVDDDSVRLERRAALSTKANRTRVERNGSDFWGNIPNHTLHRPSPPMGTSSSLPSRQRKLFDLPGFIQSWRWKFRLSAIRPSIHTSNVAPARDVDRYGIVPPSEAEVAAAMQPISDNSSIQQNQVTLGQGSQLCIHGKPTQTTAQHCGSDTETADLSYVVGCCGFYLVRRHRSSSCSTHSAAA